MLSLVLCVALRWALPLPAAAIKGDHENPNQEFGRNASYQLVGDAQFGWKTHAVAGDIDLNGHALTMETGGGNRTVFSGAIKGLGSLAWNGGNVPQVGPSILTGHKPNTFQGTLTLSKGVLDLDKPAGVDAIPGDLVIGAKGSAVVRLKKPNQINDHANVILGGPGVSGLALDGHDEQFASLTLATHAILDLGAAPVRLKIGDSRSRAWDLTKTLTIRGWQIGKDKIAFGKDATGLSPAQLARIGFADPTGLPPGLYTATSGPDGLLIPDQRVEAIKPPFDVSPKAIAERAKQYEVSGLNRLAGPATPLRDGTTIDFFGDSITWQNGYIAAITKAIKAGAGTRNKSIKLVNRGINGGGVLSLRDGSERSAYPGNSPQKPFAEVIATDKANLAVVFIGINDVWWRKTPPDVFEQALRDLMASAQSNKTATVLATLCVHGELPDGGNRDDAKIEQYAQLTRKVAADTRATLVDLRHACVAYLQNHNAQLRVDGTLYSQPSGILTYDGVHPNRKGVALLANLISDGICRALETQQPAPGN